MRLEWIILHPAAPYAALAIGLTLCLTLFISLKRDLRDGERRWRKKFDSLETELKKKASELDELSRISSQLVAPAPPHSGLNLTKRSQAVRMIRRGDTPRDIATALDLPQNEVELLVKVHRIVASGLIAPASRAAGL